MTLGALALAVSSGEPLAALWLALFAIPLEERIGSTGLAVGLAAAAGVGWTVAQYGSAPWAPWTAPVNALFSAYLIFFAGENQRCGRVRVPAALFALVGAVLAFAAGAGGNALVPLAGFVAGLVGAMGLRIVQGLEPGLVFPYEREFLDGARRSRTLSEKLGYCFQWLENNPASLPAARLCLRHARAMIQERSNPQAGNFVAHALGWFRRDGFARVADDAEAMLTVPLSWLLGWEEAEAHARAARSARLWKDGKRPLQKKARWKMLLLLMQKREERGASPLAKAFRALTEEVLTDPEFIDELQAEALAEPEVLAALEGYGIWLGLAKAKY